MTDGVSRTLQAAESRAPIRILEKKISNSVRGGGRGSLDRHMWDLVKVSNE